MMMPLLIEWRDFIVQGCVNCPFQQKRFDRGRCKCQSCPRAIQVALTRAHVHHCLLVITFPVKKGMKWCKCQGCPRAIQAFALTCPAARLGARPSLPHKFKDGFYLGQWDDLSVDCKVITEWNDWVWKPRAFRCRVLVASLLSTSVSFGQKFNKETILIGDWQQQQAALKLYCISKSVAFQTELASVGKFVMDQCLLGNTHCTMGLSPCKMGNREFESDYHHRPHFLPVQLFQTEIFVYCQLRSFTFE